MRGRLILLSLILAASAVFGQSCTPGGGVECSPFLNLWLPPFNYQIWNQPLNTNFSTIDTFASSVVQLNPTGTQIITQPTGYYFEFNNAIVYNATNPYLGFSTSTPAVFQGDLSMPTAGSFTLDTTAPGNAAANLKLSFVNAVSGYQVNGSGGSAGQALCSDGTYFDTTCAVGVFYQTVAANGSAQTQRPTLNFSGQFSLSDSSSPAETTVNIANSGVTAGTYTNATISVGADGRVTSASNGSEVGVVQVYYQKLLANSVSLTSNTPATLDSVTVNAAGGSAPAFPSSGASWRVLVCYSYYGAAGSGVVGESRVTDSASNIFAASEGGQFSAPAGTNYQACSLSPVTYDGSSSETFTVTAENTGSQTIDTTSVLLGNPSEMSVAVVASN